MTDDPLRSAEQIYICFPMFSDFHTDDGCVKDVYPSSRHRAPGRTVSRAPLQFSAFIKPGNLNCDLSSAFFGNGGNGNASGASLGFNCDPLSGK